MWSTYLLIAMALITHDYKIDFGIDHDGDNWRCLVDGVMGGRSTGKIEMTGETLLFSGKVSLANNGGFSSIRNEFKLRDLSDYETMTIRCRGTGQQFAISLETSRIWYQPYFKRNLKLKDGEWQLVTLPLSSFKECRIGRYTGNTINKNDLEAVIRFGITTNRKKEGPFEFEIDYLLFD